MYPNAGNSSGTTRTNGERWIFVESDHDKRPNDLADFNQNVGPTFPVVTPVLPAAFYNEMLPDELFDYITKCTNIQARVHFNNVASSQSTLKSWRPVRLLSISDAFHSILYLGDTRRNEEIYRYSYSNGNDT